MPVVKLIVLFFLLGLSQYSLSAPSEVQAVPNGQWASVKILENGKSLSSVKVKLFSYKNDILLFEFTEKSKKCFSVNNLSDYLSVEITNLCPDEEIPIDKLSLNGTQLELVSGDTHYFFVKEKVRAISSKALSSVWEWGNSESGGEAYGLNIYPDNNVQLTSHNEGESHMARLIMADDYMPYIVMEDTFIPVFYRGSHLDVVIDEKRSFQRTHKKLPSQFMTDENGLPVEIEHFSVSAKINGDLAETTIDIRFRTLDSRDTEVAFSLPLPASASVSGYSLDVNDRMVPAVVVPKEEARDALETLESRGVDPAIAELTQNNKFQTEIYPVSKENPRRIQIQYQETLQAVDGTYRYSIPLDILGKFKQIALDIELEGIDTISHSPSSVIRTRQFKTYTTSKNKKILRFNADNFSADSELAFNLKPQKVSALQVQSGSDENIYFRLPLHLNAAPFTPESILVLWDTSLSMKAYHVQYLVWLIAVRREFPAANIRVQLFSTDNQQPVNLTTSVDAVKSFASGIVYDGASDLNNIKGLVASKEVANEQVASAQDSTLLLFSDATHSVGLLDLQGVSAPVYAVYPDARTSNMPLLETLAAKGNLTRVNNLSVNEFFSVLDDVDVKSKSNNILVKRRFDTKNPIEILGALSKDDLPSSLVVNIDGETKELLVTDGNLLEGKSIQYQWATNKIQPLLINPQQHKQAIIDAGMKHSIVTPYTSLLVLENLDDYVEFGVKPPALFDPDNEYDELRAEHVAQESKAKRKTREELLVAWKQRVAWYEDPVAFNQQFLKEKKARESSALDEVMVTGARASASTGDSVEEVVVQNLGDFDGGIKVVAWNPDTPYMKAIRAAPIEKAYITYLQQRNEYVANMSFYMDVAKYFFDNKQSEIAYKILSNISELMPEKMLAQRLVAYTLIEYQQWEPALLYLNFVNEIVPYEATSKRDLAVLLERMATSKTPGLIAQSANYYWQSILLDDSFQHDLAITTIGELNNLIQVWNVDPNSISGFDQRFISAMEFDLRVVISWTNDQADMDLHLHEPDKTEVYYGNRYSKSGAWLPFDNTSGFGPEEYLLKSAGKGIYKVAADFYSNSSVETFGPVTVHVDIYRNYGRKNQVHKATTVRLDNEKDASDLAEITVH